MNVTDIVILIALALGAIGGFKSGVIKSSIQERVFISWKENLSTWSTICFWSFDSWWKFVYSSPKAQEFNSKIKNIKNFFI